MNILFVNDIPFNPIGGGLERVTDILTKELLRRGHTIYYLCCKLGPKRQFLLDYQFPVRVYQLPCDGLFDNDENIAFYHSLQSELEIDIVINQRGLGGKFNSLLPNTATKLISVIHSRPDASVIQFLQQLTILTVPPFAKFKKVIKQTFPFITSYYWEKRALQELKKKYCELAIHSDAVVTLSKECIKMMHNLTVLPHKARITSIPNPNTFSVAEPSLEAKEKVILYVGRLAKLEKEPLRLLKIWRYLHKKYPDWQLKIVGEGDEKDNMISFAKEHQLNNVHFEGSQSNVAQYYRKASIVCLTSNFEGWGMALTEGMQHGCIPFTFNNYGAAFEIIDDGINGCLIPAFRLKKYASRLSELMENQSKRNEMAKAAIEKVKIFSVENIADKWEQLFQSIHTACKHPIQ